MIIHPSLELSFSRSNCSPRLFSQLSFQIGFGNIRNRLLTLFRYWHWHLLRSLFWREVAFKPCKSNERLSCSSPHWLLLNSKGLVSTWVGTLDLLDIVVGKSFVFLLLEIDRYLSPNLLIYYPLVKLKMRLRRIWFFGLFRDRNHLHHFVRPLIVLMNLLDKVIVI